MKKRFTAILTALLCMTGTVLSLPVSAEFRIENGVLVGDIGDDINEGLTMPDKEDSGVEYVCPELEYTLVTDVFSYCDSNLGSANGFFLETKAEGTENIAFMVVGVSYNRYGELGGYYVTSINEWSLGFGKISQYNIKKQMGDIQLTVGDLLALNGPLTIATSEIPGFIPQEEGTISYIGHGIDVLGKEFEKVIRMQLFIEQNDLDLQGDYGIDLLKGDVNVDDEISILDCLSINRNLLIGEPLCDYAKLAGDINENGTIDAVDSLSILKECINITENFE